MALEPGDAKFESKLDEASKKKAKDELNEINDKDRELAVQAFRKTILDLKWLKTPTDFEFLLRFLRVRKYSQLSARESFENYWTYKAEYPLFFKNANPKDPVCLEILRSGFYTIPLKRDKDGCRVIIGQPGRLDANQVLKWGVDNVYKTILMVYEWVIRDENVQVNGMKFFMDYSGATLALAKIFSGDNQKALLKFFQLCFDTRLIMTEEDPKHSYPYGLIKPGRTICIPQKALPIRMKGMYLYNAPSFFEVLFAVISPFMSQKMKDRMHFVGRNMATVYENIDMCVLPEEYLPDEYTGPNAGPLSKIVDDMVEGMTSPEFVDYITTLCSGKYRADLKAKAGTNQDDVPVASFRKLNVD